MGNIQLSIDKNTGVIYAGTWNTTNIYNYQQIDSRSAISNFKDILIQIDSNNTYSSEEKVMIKGNLAKINDIIISTGATGVKLMPWIQLLGSLFH
jgi:hypothetical protein